MTACTPTESVDVANVALPDPSSVPLPSEIPSARKMTIPSGVPAPLVTLAVRVTGAPKLGLAEAETVIVVGASNAAAGVGASANAARLKSPKV